MKQIFLISLFFAFQSFNLFAQAAPGGTIKKAVTIKDSSSGNDGLIWTKVEQEASFRGGNAAWNRYLEKNLHWNVAKKNKAPNGRYQVIAKFIVSQDGKIYSAECETEHGYGMEDEVIRVIKKSPVWNPAILNGKPVNAYRRQPVTFVIE